MRKTLVVAWREYQAAVKTKAFLVGLLLMPLMFGGGVLVQALVRNNADTRDKRVAGVDYPGHLCDGLAAAAQLRNENQIFEGEGASRKQIQPRYIFERVDAN